MAADTDAPKIHGIDTTIADPLERIKAFTALWQNDAYQGFDTDLVRHRLRVDSYTPPSPPSASTPAAPATPPTITFTLTIPASYSNRMGNLHGGAAALIFDVCTTAALAPIAAPGFYSYAGVTRSLNVTYLRPVPVGSEVSVVCEVLHAGRRLVTIRGEIRVEGKVCAVVEHLKANIDPPPGEGRRLVRGGRL